MKELTKEDIQVGMELVSVLGARSDLGVMVVTAVGKQGFIYQWNSSHNGMSEYYTSFRNLHLFKRVPIVIRKWFPVITTKGMSPFIANVGFASKEAALAFVPLLDQTVISAVCAEWSD